MQVASQLADSPTTIRTVRQRDDLSEALSPREFEIARLTAEGFSNKEIARTLEISPHTVSSHLRHAFAKLGVNRRSRLSSLVALLEARAP